MPGPVGKRVDRKMGHRTQVEKNVDKSKAGDVVVWPQADPEWPTPVSRWYRSLEVSGQSQFYEQADAEYAYMWADVMATEFHKGRFNAQVLMAFNNANNQLLATEGSRRRARVELQRDNAKTVEQSTDLSEVQSQISAA